MPNGHAQLILVFETDIQERKLRQDARGSASRWNTETTRGYTGNSMGKVVHAKGAMCIDKGPTIGNTKSDVDKEPPI